MRTLLEEVIMTYKILKPFNKGTFTNLLEDSIKVLPEKPINQSQFDEGKTLGLTLICRTTDPNYNYYKNDKCGHFAFYQPTHVRRNNISCKTCLLNSYAEQAFEKGFHYLFSMDSVFRLYIKPCGHISSMSPQSVRTYEWKCNDCFEESLEKSANKHGYVYDKHDSRHSGSYRYIKFVSCGHEKNVIHQQITRGNVVCRICIEDDITKKCESIGLTTVENLSDRYRIFKLPCGHHKKLRVDHAMCGSYLCEHCDDSQYTKPSKLYLIRFDSDEFSWLKLGYAKDIDNRKSNYGICPTVSHELLFQHDFEKGYDALLFEKDLHRHFKQFRLHSKFMKQFHKNNGFTECYPVTMQDAILNEIERKLNGN